MRLQSYLGGLEVESVVKRADAIRLPGAGEEKHAQCMSVVPHFTEAVRRDGDERRAVDPASGTQKPRQARPNRARKTKKCPTGLLVCDEVNSRTAVLREGTAANQARKSDHGVWISRKAKQGITVIKATPMCRVADMKRSVRFASCGDYVATPCLILGKLVYRFSRSTSPASLSTPPACPIRFPKPAGMQSRCSFSAVKQPRWSHPSAEA